MGNKYIDTEAPWKLAKADIERLKTVLYVLIEVIRRLAIILEPVMPEACAELLDQAGADHNMRTFLSISSKLTPGSPMGAPKPVFPKIDTGNEAMAATKAALKVPALLQTLNPANKVERSLDEIIKLIETKGNDIRQLKVLFK